MVRSGTLKETDPVRREGADKWTRAREVIGLFRAAAKEPAKAEPEAKARPEAQAEPKPGAAPGRSEQPERPPSQPPRIGRRRVVMAVGLIGALVLLVAGVSAWRANRRERFPEPRRAGPRVVQQDAVAPLAAARSSIASTPVPDDPVPEPVRDDAAPLKARFTLDFRKDFETKSVGLTASSAPDRYFTVEPAGLRVTIPDDSEEQYCAADPRIRVKGDFRITARYTILDIPRPQAGFGPGVSLWVEDAQGERAGAERRHREREGHVFGSYRGRPQRDDTYRHSAPFRQTSSDALSGWLRLARVGDQIHYQIAGPHVERFVEIHQEDFTDADLERLRLVVQTGGSPTAIDAVWNYFDVQAEELVKTF
jgi:hypothetical protein